MNRSMIRGVVVVLVFLGSWAWGAWGHAQDSQVVRDGAFSVIVGLDGYEEHADYFEEILDAEHPAAFSKVREMDTPLLELRLATYFDVLLSGMERRASEDGREQVARQLARLKAELMAG